MMEQGVGSGERTICNLQSAICNLQSVPSFNHTRLPAYPLTHLPADPLTLSPSFPDVLLFHSAEGV